MRARGFSCLVTALAIFLILPSFAEAQIGKIEGRVINAETGVPLPFANVMVVNTEFGSMTLEDGSFTILIPEGSYTIRCIYMGYEQFDQENVIVMAEQTVTLNFNMAPSVALTVDTIVVEGEAPAVDVKSSSVGKRVGADDLKNFAVDNVEEAMALQAGITMQGGSLHVRGGRSGEVTFMIDGVPVNDPLGGKVEVSNVAIAEAEAVIGGMDAEFGNAQSAVFNITTREGGSQFEGTFRFYTDDYGRQDKTYTNYDRVSFGMGGPFWNPDFRWYISGEGSWSDGENLTL
ncbi:MAG: TonB-dependent receptor, partial [Candidatus Krumholzibacteria bacterium]|nr:TonB-dependent receptor [Candidatus Krumholzibacteria bacterium]